MQVGLDPSDMKLITALIVIIALVMPRVSASYKDRKRRNARMKKREQDLVVMERSEVKKHA